MKLNIKIFRPGVTAQFIFCFSILIIAFGRCNSTSQKVDIDKNIAAVKKYHEVWSNGNIKELDKIIAPNFKSHFIGGFEYQGIEGAKNSVLETKKAFPDWKEEIVDIIAQDDKVVTRYHSTGTQFGNWDGIDSTGNKVDIYEASIYRLEKGKIVEQWGFWDEINLKKQMAAKSNQSK
jgi:predicted ester cyclase